jgi:hypothetical protein
MEYDIDPVNMTYCGKEFLNIVDVKSSKSPYRTITEAICHLCQLSHLNPHELADHLDGEKHYKNLRSFIMGKEYDIYTENLDDPIHTARYPDFNTYMLSRYPGRVEEYFDRVEKDSEKSSEKRRTEFVLKYQPAKLLLSEQIEEMKLKKMCKLGFSLPKVDHSAEQISRSLGTTGQIPKFQSPEVPKFQGRPRSSGVPISGYSASRLQEPSSSLPTSTPTFIPTDATEVQPKAVLCEEFESTSQCQYGTKCMYAHGSSELNTLTYRRTKTAMCQLMTNGICPQKIPCGFAHHTDEIVLIGPKTLLCRSYIQRSSCQYNDKCQFAHGMKELKSPWDEQPIASKAYTFISKATSPVETDIKFSPNSTSLNRSDSVPEGRSSSQKPNIKLTLKKTSDW